MISQSTANLTRSAGGEPVVTEKKGCTETIKALACLVLFIVVAGAVGGFTYLGIALSDPILPRPDPPVTRDKNLYRSAAVAADAAKCSELGREILRDGGGAIDAAITCLLCIGLYNPHSAGIGGGSFTLYYDRNSENVTFLDSRETAPAAADRNLYVNMSAEASLFGGLAIGVPGEVKGYWEAHQRYGKLAWEDLFKPVIKIAEEGDVVSPELAFAIQYEAEVILDDPNLREILTDRKGNLLQEGDVMYRPHLARTLRTIATEGADAFYNGLLAETIASEIQAAGGIITVEDLAGYMVRERTPISIDIGDLRAFSGPPPSSGVVFGLIMNILEGYGFTEESITSSENRTLTYHRIMEAFKFAYAKRSSLGDEAFVNVSELVENMIRQSYADGLRAKIDDTRTFNYTYYEPEFMLVQDSGTSHIAIIDQFGNAASITSTINTFFGSKVRGGKTGIIYNNEMDDFSRPGVINFFGVPPSVPNFIEPGKRPQSSMTPVIVIDGEGDVRLVVGAAGGTRITLGTSLVTMETLWFGSNLTEAIDRRRIYHQLFPTEPFYETGFPSDILAGLRGKGHEPEEQNLLTCWVHAVERRPNGWLLPYSDPRAGGEPAGF